MKFSPLRWRYLWLIAVPLGLVFCMWQAALLAREQALTNLQEEAENELRLSAANLNGYLLRYDYLPQLLATREGVQRFLASPNRQDPMPLNLLLDRFRFTSGVSDVYLLDRDADTVAASNWHRPNTFIGQNYAFRSYYREAMAGGEGRFYGLGLQSQERGYYFSAPVWLDDTSPDARPDGVLVIKVLLNDVEESWAEQDSTLFVTDDDNIIFLASQPELRMNALYPLTEGQRQALHETKRYGQEPLTPSGIQVQDVHGAHSQIVTFQEEPLSDGHYLNLTREIPEFGWQMHILKPLSPVVNAQWMAALMAGGLYGVVTLAAGIGWQRLRLRRERETFAERERQTLARVRDELEMSVERRTRDLVASNQRLSDEIDERRRAEANLRQTQDELIQAAKLAVLGQLAAGINHELNQPLAAIRAYSENARRFIELSRVEQADANLEQIIELTQRMADISAQLRQFSRKSSDRPETISVQACADYALRLFQSRLRDDHVRVEQHWPEDTLWVKADLVRLEQVLVNLIGNALQAMKETATPQLTLSAHAENQQIIIRVADNGPGIPPSYLEQVFEPFFTTKAPGSGLGLGLSISSRIMDDLGGKLQAANLPDSGACFTIILPLAPAPRATQEIHSDA
ncbi:MULTISPECIES: sensor histidine kinase [unclassified Halomonas]|uniref:sensor histidine kinase n=1 Tax=unclassified Halomonas TaxID=2609666 RepID=UPI0006DB4DDC|nr:MULTISPECIES: ATP-binding protein [unclassified Halomonas]KPQ22596.1 MAG: C4-dicarboylate transport two component signal transduction system histidine kinase DctB [Halomonas sp. HL-93]SBR51765.1 two-component system, NtrC family, C4-dicarboxylate transport sensor histidine kinase DctB [Halomonas sp. HL-93]SNY97503.1 two-component system, NtrC family, C4-dicarboxylate transport sensor histidine kinase DctB [Halomonas sp. hl-4]